VMCLHAKAYTSKYSANYILGVCSCLLVWAVLTARDLTCVDAQTGRWAESALRGDPAGGLRVVRGCRRCARAGGMANATIIERLG
jgi:hypothetical protein